MACALFWGSAVSTSWARINALETIETYGFAVHQQLLYNFAVHGDFFQTIHMGYDDAWTWSGHRALTLPVVAWMVGFTKGIHGLGIISAFLVSTGAFWSGLLARQRMGTWGMVLGVGLFVLSPCAMVIAVQDYQDLSLALPALLFCMWALGTQKLWLVFLGVLVGMSPREECVALVWCVAVLFSPQDDQWAGIKRNLFCCFVVTLVVVGGAEWLYPFQNSGHDMPLQNAIRTLRQGTVFLTGWPYLERFYLLIWVPLGLLACLSPLVAGPALVLSFLHMTVPEGHGVDRSWSQHSHHMAPAVAFAISASICGAARIWRWSRRFQANALGRVIRVVFWVI
ncbi:MAG TPA: DUF2079 domain-containing protein, partial [Myxococcales bacterium]|nr:DUF2079 domain-containing protein [Myxococcales bacterium]